MTNETHPGHALVRVPGASFVRALSSSGARIDVRLAQAQHAEYCQALRAAGLAVETLPADERYPDSCFMQDPALVIGGQGVACRPGAPSRLGEEEEVARWLARRAPVARIDAPGTLEGGDVLVLPGRVLVGLSERSNMAGIEQLRAILAGQGLAVRAIPVGRGLHLLSGVGYLGRGLLLAARSWAGHPAFAGLEVLPVPDDEAYAANVLALGDHVVMPAGYPKVEAMLWAQGFTVLPVDVSEFGKADGGVTCLALLY